MHKLYSVFNRNLTTSYYEMVFCASVKTIRTCPPQTSTAATSAASRSGKIDMHFSNKVIAQLAYYLLFEI